MLGGAVIRGIRRMRMLSFRVRDDEAHEIRRWAKALAWTAQRYCAMPCTGTSLC
jgi:hypothetical protein